MKYRYNKLRGRIVEVMEKPEKFAKALGINVATLNRKLSSNAAWKQDEITKAIDILHIEPEKVVIYFFTLDDKN